MAQSNSSNTANGVISVIVVLCGITFSALIGSLATQAVETNTSVESESHGSQLDSAIAYASAPLWSFGFAFIIPGLIGIIGFFVKAKGAYITQMVFCIITLLVMGIFCIVAFMVLGVLITTSSTLDTCHDVGGKCDCGSSFGSGSSFGDSDSFSSTDNDLTFPYSCESLRSMTGKGIGIMLMIVIGWIFTLVITILSGILACRQENPGMIIQHQPVGTTVVHLSPVAGMPPQPAYMPPQPAYMPPQPAYMPQTSDHAKLVHNMEY